MAGPIFDRNLQRQHIDNSIAYKLMSRGIAHYLDVIEHTDFKLYSNLTRKEVSELYQKLTDCYMEVEAIRRAINERMKRFA